MLINLNAKVPHFPEYVQVEKTVKMKWTDSDDHLYNRLKQALFEGSVAVDFKFLLALYLQF